MTDLVVISLEVWDEVWRRNQHLVAGLMRNGAVDCVLFVEPAVDALHDLRSGRRPQLAKRGPRAIPAPDGRGQLWAMRPTKLLPRRVDPRGDGRRARTVVRTAQKLGLRDPVLWINDPGGVEVLRLSGWPALYDITDDWLVADRPQRELARLRAQESELFDGCAQVVVCSPALEWTKSEQRDVILIPNAVDVDAYRHPGPRPEDLPDPPVALYLGTAHRDRVDVDLVVATAEAFPGTVVLVGPAPLPGEDLDRLRRVGVQILGPRASDQVPAYLQHADVLLVPHVLTDFTASLDPIKAYEYRAARRPVVSTPVPGFVDTTDPMVSAVKAPAFPAEVVRAARAPLRASDGRDDIPTWMERSAQMADVIRQVGRTQP